MSDHLAAYLLKKKFPHLTWIADFRDLPIEPHYKLQFFPEYHHYIYKKIFSVISVMTTVSQGLSKELQRYGRTVSPVMNGIKENLYFLRADLQKNLVWYIPDQCMAMKGMQDPCLTL
jgi:hypothetical protein